MAYTMNDAENFTPSMLGAEIIAGYIGGPDADGAPWTDQQWAACGHKPKLPIWVPSPNATADAARKVDLFKILDSAVHFQWPAGQLIAVDLETSKADSSYVAELASCLTYFHLAVLAYGSLSTIDEAVPSYIWKWSASWGGTPHLDVGMEATQWTSDKLAGVPYDQSVVSQGVYDHLVWR